MDFEHFNVIASHFFSSQGRNIIERSYFDSSLNRLVCVLCILDATLAFQIVLVGVVF
jgi:hypothetical protein